MILAREYYQSTRIFMIFARKINTVPEFYVILARKMPEFYMIIGRKIFFLNFWGHVPPYPPPPSHTPMTYCLDLSRCT